MLDKLLPTSSAELNRAPEDLPIEPAAVREHVARILRTTDFAAAPQLSTLLQFIVERKLAGTEGSLKAYTIATEALGRPTSFDPQNDPIVRVQARRLRQALLLYYAAAGADEPMRIVLPLGGYIPAFVASHTAAGIEPPITGIDKPADNRLFPTPWVAPTALILSIVSIIINLITLWPGIIPIVLSKFR